MDVSYFEENEMKNLCTMLWSDDETSIIMAVRIIEDSGKIFQDTHRDKLRSSLNYSLHRLQMKYGYLSNEQLDTCGNWDIALLQIMSYL